jgi:phosphoadenosine phosphosulfate reductase
MRLLTIETRENVAIERLRQFEPPEGYYLAFSGGKDSIVLHELARRSGVKFDAHYSITSVDPPEIIYFIRNNYANVSMDSPGTTMWELIPKKLMPPTRLVRYCCEVLKEGGGDGRTVLTGVRWAESKRRLGWGIAQVCEKRSKITVCPIVDWEDAEIWEYIGWRGLKYPSLYDQGFNRLGCIGCPLSSNQERELNRWPKYRAGYIRAFERMLEQRRIRGKKTDWKTGEDVMSWWINK